ncbi:MotA/TolQ/ExbB proton channel family protein [candidate division WOR-3 bacterium]|nr:MotA/TolQ/ExbB proton channel family protein [candidate division WOR-3 bacterium]
MGVIQFYREGGWAMHLLLVSALIGLFFMFERIIFLFFKTRPDPIDYVEKLTKDIKSKKGKDGVDSALKKSRSDSFPIAKISSAILEKASYGKDEMEEARDMEALKTLSFLDRGMLVLAAVANIAPLIGFLGTVVGMMMAFEAIAKAGTVEPTIVADGIRVALITTAAGLMIAFPVSAFHVWFSSRINSLSRKFEEATSILVETVLEQEIEE